MKGLTLQASKRETLGKKTRFLRRQDITPTHLFGHGIESLSLQCDNAALKQIIAQAGTTRLIALEIDGDKQPRNVFIREVRRDACTRALLHVDFYQIKMEEKMKSEVPIILVGEAPALKEKGRTLMYGVTSLNVECLPDKLPPQIEIDLSLLKELDQTIHVSDIALSADITLITDPEQLVVKVSEVFVEKVEEVMEEVEEVAEVAAEAAAEAPAEAKPKQEAAE
ncbi:50S ribosomal protein L25 [Chloroflexota bacterium]